jgi:hypothetical protein
MKCEDPMCVDCLRSLLDYVEQSGVSRVNTSLPKTVAVSILRDALVAMAAGRPSLPDTIKSRLLKKNILKEVGLSDLELAETSL